MVNLPNACLKLSPECQFFILEAIAQQSEIELQQIRDKIAEVEKALSIHQRNGRTAEKWDVLGEALEELLKNLVEKLERVGIKYGQSREWLNYQYNHTCPAIRGG